MRCIGGDCGLEVAFEPGIEARVIFALERSAFGGEAVSHCKQGQTWALLQFCG